MSSIVCACGKPVEERSDCAGQWITCPSCGGTLYQPFPGDKPSVPTAAPTRLCAVCSETIPVADATCKYCGGNPNGVAPAQPAAAPPPPVSSGAALANDGGLPFLIIALVGYFVCGLLCPVAWAMAANHEKECRAKGVEVSGTAKAGKVIGILGTIFLGINVIFFVLWVVASCL
jgi:hypothetical protein